MTKNTQTTKKTRTSRATKKAPRKSAKATKATKTARAKKPRAKAPATAAARKSAAPKAEEPARPRDPRLPAPGTTLVRPYKGKDYEIEVLESGFRWNGEEYSSLSKLARVITGQASINGYLWARLTEPKRAAGKPAKRARKAAAEGRETVTDTPAS